MVLGYHVILGMYGFWLPNDPRGSWSEFVWSEALSQHGDATKVDTRDSVAGAAHDVNRRMAAKRDLQFPPVVLNGQQALSVAKGIAQAAELTGAPIWACSVLPEHVHLAVGRFDGTIEDFVAEAKQRATLQLNAAGLHPLADARTSTGRRPTPWARGFWKVFLNDEAHVWAAIRYVEENPVKEGKRRQHWSFVTPFDPHG
ncbi:MAG: hypothetical protein AB7U20_09595 [Planctomycetaceae bacterium]